MPLIKDIVLNEADHKKKFQKKAYRPWDDDMPIKTYDIPEESNYIPSGEKVNMQVLPVADVANVVSLQLISQSHGNLLDELDLEKSLRDLYGAQRVIFKFLIGLQVQELENIFVTQPIATNEIALATKLPMNTITTVIGRLKIKKLLQTYENKPGRGGYGRYSFSKYIYSFFLKKFTEV